MDIHLPYAAVKLLLLLAVLAVILTAAAAAWLRQALRRSRARAAGHPEPREVWWAEVPFEDGPGSKDRPCLVIRVNRTHATVAKITSKHHAERPGVLPLPRGTVGDRQGRASWLETDELREVPIADFRRKVGTVDVKTWGLARRAVR